VYFYTPRFDDLTSTQPGRYPICTKMRQPICKPGGFPLAAAVILFVFCAEDLAEPLCGGLADGLLDMEVMPGHIQIGMADDGLDRGQIHAHGLHLGYIGMAAAVGRQQPHAGDLRQSLPELVPEMAGVAGVARLPGRLPDVGTALLPQRQGAPARLGGMGTSR